MNSGDNHGPEHDIAEKIVSQMRSIAKGSAKQIAPEELQNLKRAASRLDQMLNAASDADRQALKNAAARLDQLLSEIRAGKDPTSIRKRHESSGS